MASPRLQRAARAVVLVASMLFFFAGSLELGIRVLLRLRPNPVFNQALADHRQLDQKLADSFRFVPADGLPYALKPNFRVVAPDGSVTEHNEAGFRAPPFPKAPLDEKTLRVICIGGSTTYGVGVNRNQDTYPAQLEAQLRSQGLPAPFSQVQVYNLGAGGYTTVEMKETLRKWIGPLEPQAVLIHCGVNDVAPRLFEKMSCDYSHFRKPLELPEPKAWHRPFQGSRLIMYAAYRMGRLTPLTLQNLTQRPLPSPDAAERAFAANGPQCFQEHVSEMIALARGAGARVWLVTQSYLESPDFAAPDADTRAVEALYRKGLEEHAATLRALAAAEHTGLIDLEAEMPAARWLYVDPIHLNRDGNAVKARLAAEAMLQTLQSSESPPV